MERNSGNTHYCIATGKQAVKRQAKLVLKMGGEKKELNYSSWRKEFLFPYPQRAQAQINKILPLHMGHKNHHQHCEANLS